MLGAGFLLSTRWCATLLWKLPLNYTEGVW
jgi:hypothetical protein